MFYRLFAAGIILFWLAMGTLLVRTELFPDRGNTMQVPVDYLEQLVFRHEQTSDLLLYAQKKRLDGSFHVQPKRVPAAPDQKLAAGDLLGLSGNFLLTLPGIAGQRLIFHGGLEMDEHGPVRGVDLSISLHQPKQSSPGLALHLDGHPGENQWRYQVTQGTGTLSEGDGTPEEILQKLDLRNYGIDTRVFSQVGIESRATTMSAHRGILRVNDEDIETYVLAIHQGEGMDLTVYINQLGQILAVKTFLGYDLYDETLAP